MRLKLITNGSRPLERFIKRWGLAILVDDDILFDAFGNARVLMANVRRFKVKLDRLEHMVISHDHWDHINGIASVLAARPGLRVHVPTHADPLLKERIRYRGGLVCEIGRSALIKDGVFSTGEIMGRDRHGEMAEQALVVETMSGIALLAGCAHPGIVEMVKHVKRRFRKPVYAVIGGLHLKESTDEDVSVQAARLRAAGVRMVVPLHCTGARAVKILRQAFGRQCHIWREGQELVL